MLRRPSLGPVVLLALLLSPYPVLAQGLPSGVLGGTVTSRGDAQPLPGVSVTLRSPALQGLRTAVTTANGHWVVPNLPPGTYAVEVMLDGFETVTRGGIPLGTAQRQDVDVAMSVAAVSAEVLVTAEGEQISRTSQGATTLTAPEVEKLPVSRTIESVVLLAPGVNANGTAGAVTISGGESYENSFNIDGIQVQDSWRATLEPVYVEDAVAETTTQTSGISAEFGRFAGGTVNVVTKTGGNVFSGSLRSTLVNDAWSAVTPAGEERSDDVTPIWEATVGGPLWMDRVWFFGAGRLLDQTRTGTTAAPTSIDFPEEKDEKRLQLKLTASPLQGHTLTASWLGLDRKEKGIYYANVPILDLDSRYDDGVREDLLLANYTGTFSPWLFGEASYGRRRYVGDGGGSTYTDLVKGTVAFDQVTLRSYNAPLFCSVCPDPEDRRSSDHGVVKLTAFASTKALGSHTVVGGLELFRGTWVWNQYQTGSGYGVWETGIRYEGGELYPVLGPGTYLQYTPVLTPAKNDDAKTWAAYVNDTWRLGNRLSLNVGLRWDRNDVRDPTGATQSTEGSLSPRLGVTWDLAGNGRIRVTAGWGRYVSTVNEWMLGWAYAPGMPAILLYFYDGPPVNVDPSGPRVTTDDALRQLFSWFGITAPGEYPRAGIDPFYAFYPGVSFRMRGDLKSQKADELTLGVNGSLGRSGSFRVEAVHREYSDFYAYACDLSTGKVEDPLGNSLDLAYLTSVNEPLERRYDALRTSFEARPAPSLAISGSWTWSRTRGNQTSETTNNGAIPQDVLTYPEYRELSWNAPVGDLAQDVRHRVRLWATWDLTFVPAALGRFTLTPLFSLDTGQPYGAHGPVLVDPYVTNPGYATPPWTVDYWFTGRDAFRMPTVTSLDLALAWRLDVGPVELFVQPQLLNVLNRDAVVTSDPRYVDLGVFTAATSAELQPFDPFQEKPVEGIHWVRSPTFGEAFGPASYQQPRTFRVSVGVRF